MGAKSNLIIPEIRRFNRFYTKILGLINQHVLDSKYSLTEARVLFEIKHLENCTANSLIEELRIDRGYISRILKRFEADELIYKENCSLDRRAYILRLTPKGEQVLSNLNQNSDWQISSLINHLEEKEQEEIINSMSLIQRKLSLNSQPTTIKAFQPQDIKYIIERHKELYGSEHGFDHNFVSYVTDTLRVFIENQNRDKENIWVAESNGILVGSIGVVKVDDFTAQLRWLLIEPNMRGKGLGNRLVKTAVSFCKERKYKLIFLWTVNTLIEARNLYLRNGFTLTDTVEHDIWGKHLVEERWDLPIESY